jgi:PAS domain S-box-containing protein
MTQGATAVLLIEDSETDALLLREALTGDLIDRFEVVTVDRLAAGLQLLAQRHFDVALLDLGLPDSQGLSTFERLHAAAPEVPVVVFSGNLDTRAATEAVQLGAQDYLVKGQTAWDSAPRAIRYAIERQRSQALLQQNQHRLRLLIENAPGAIALVGGDGKVIFASASSLRVIGYPADEFIGKDPAHITHPDDLPALIDLLADLMQHPGQIQTTEYRVLHKNGTYIWVQSTISNLLQEPGIHALAFNYQEITERKRAQEQLRELNRTLEERVAYRTAEVQDLYDNAPCGYHSLDGEGRYVHVNATELAWLGRSREEVIGHHISEFVDAAGWQLFAEGMPELIAKGHIKETELDFVRPDGTHLPVLLNATALYDADGSFVMSRSTLFDVLERKQTAEALRLANLDLVRALRIKDEFLANMSHELRTPLNTILVSSEVLADEITGPINERQRRYVSTIDMSGRHLLALINDILDLSKIEADRMTLDLEDIAADEICRSCLLFVKDQAVRKSLQVDYQSDASGLWMAADPRRLKQMLINLLSNAVKFTPEGGRVTLDVHAEPDADRIAFAVQDTGIGIPPDDIDKLFQPFMQLDSRRASRQEGTGLGLALVSRLAQVHGGSVHVESAGVPGLGSCFTLLLPLHGPALTNPI